MSNLDGIDHKLSSFTEDRANIERALAPSRTMTDLVKLLQTPPHIAGIVEIAKAMRPPAHLTAVSQMMTAMQRENSLFVELARRPLLLDDITKQFAQMRKVGESIAAPYRVIQEMLRSQSAVFEGLSARVAGLETFKLSFPQFAQTTLAWNVASIGLVNRMKDIGLLDNRIMLSTRLFEAPNAYTTFVRHTTERLATDPKPEIAARLRGSLNLAEHQLLGIADVVSGYIVVPDDEEKPDDTRVLNAPFAQQNELLAFEAFGDENDIETMTNVSPTAQTAQISRRVLELVTQCNEAGKTSAYGMEIFKPTTRLMTVFSDLPWLSPTDRFRFGDLIDCLYYIFYEGAGKDNLRYLGKYGGPLTEADCDLIWCIKHLRNKWLRHDSDHGKEKDTQKSWAELAAKLRWLGLAEHPTDAHHFQQLHHRLLVLAEDFLVHILNEFKLKQ